MDNTDFKTPGQFIEALLEERGWTQRILAIILGVDETGINKLITGKKQVTAEMALLLSEVFVVPPEAFLDLQKQYELAQARIISRPDPNRSTRAHLFGGLPVSEMVKRRWLDAEDVRNVTQIQDALVKFFKVNSVQDIEILPHAAKKTNTFIPTTPAQLAWVYRVKEISEDIFVPKYSNSKLNAGIERLRSLLSAPEESRKVPRILLESGIRFVVVESISSAKIDGVCLWLNEYSPVIGMSLRFDRIDNFWFVLRHEIEHVLRGHGQTAIMVDVELEGERAGTGPDLSDEERIANEAAAEFCVPQKYLDGFIARKSPFFSERDVIGFARTLQIHPGLVAGQLQHRTGKYDRFRQHLVKIRRHIAPSAIVDGWGDVAPVGL